MAILAMQNCGYSCLNPRNWGGKRAKASTKSKAYENRAHGEHNVASNRAACTHRELTNAGEKDSHHIIQDAAVKNIPGYNRKDAPAVQLYGLSTSKGSEHYIATQVQCQRGGGTYAAERRIGYKSLRKAWLKKSEAREHIRRADEYFYSLGVTPETQMRSVGNRNR